MQAIQIERTGGPEVLSLVDIPVPSPAADQALIRIEASGVNFIDTYFREGRYPAQLPYTLGQEAAGTVTAIGADVTTVREGDRVAWSNVPGTYAQMAIVAADRLIKIPDTLTTQQAAAAMLQGMTAHYLATSTYPIQPGDRVLIHAGAGGVGLLLIQIAKMLGATVFTTTSTEEKASLARDAGADEVILYTSQDFPAEIKRLTQSELLPVVYDSVGKTTFEGSLQCLRRLGLLALYGGSSGAVPPFDLIRLSTMGSLYITRPTLKDHIASRADLEARAGDVLNWVAEGRLKLRFEHTYPLADAAQAHRDLTGRKTTGKLLLLA